MKMNYMCKIQHKIHFLKLIFCARHIHFNYIHKKEKNTHSMIKREINFRKFVQQNEEKKINNKWQCVTDLKFRDEPSN